ncbi:hypothetical protein OIO90_000264 [Microbotryomycetes sp. JL221]|nr:hypothetical protein OIO90_000264 [Microbotryomycetes sp. JL221]
MPELPEVERARARLHGVALGNVIQQVEAFDDTIVFLNTTASAFQAAIQGKTVIDVKRKGKNFYLLLDSPPHPAFHLGMSGQAFIRGQPGDSYRRGRTVLTEWPPKYTKACLTFTNPVTREQVGEWAFCDSRRFGRVQLIDAPDPELVPPLSLLGRDPLLDMVTLEEMGSALSKRNAPVKAVLLDQNGPFCGIGNWMVDEILYHSRLHPAHPSSALTADELSTLHHNIHYVTTTAVTANAEASAFPSHWLFKKRWGKGRRADHTFILPDGTATKIIFETVGGRTSAIVEGVQKLPHGIVRNKKRSKSKRKETDTSDSGKSGDEAFQDHDEDEAGADNIISRSFELDTKPELAADENNLKPQRSSKRNRYSKPAQTSQKQRKSTRVTVTEVVAVPTSTTTPTGSKGKKIRKAVETIEKKSDVFTLPGLGSPDQKRPSRSSRRS